MSGRGKARRVNETLDLESQSKLTYTLVEPLGQGGNASAFMAICTKGPHRGMPFAVKFFLHESARRRKSFLEEMEYLRDNPHPAILPVHDVGQTTDESPFYVSQYMSTTLERVIVSEATPMLDKLLYSNQLCSALNGLAEASPPILHRDLKAENVFVTGRTCVLGDFGMMQRVGAKGSVADMSMKARTPDILLEKLQGTAATSKSDVFALGLVLYRLFTGEQLAVPAKDKWEPIRLESPVSVGGRYADQLDNILAEMVDFNPATRMSAEKLQTAFVNLIRDESRRLRVTRVRR